MAKQQKQNKTIVKTGLHGNAVKVQQQQKRKRKKERKKKKRKKEGTIIGIGLNANAVKTKLDNHQNWTAWQGSKNKIRQSSEVDCMAVKTK